LTNKKYQGGFVITGDRLPRRRSVCRLPYSWPQTSRVRVIAHSKNGSKLQEDFFVSVSFADAKALACSNTCCAHASFFRQCQAAGNKVRKRRSHTFQVLTYARIVDKIVSNLETFSRTSTINSRECTLTYTMNSGECNEFIIELSWRKVAATRIRPM